MRSCGIQSREAAGGQRPGGSRYRRLLELCPLGLALILALLSSCATRAKPGAELELLSLLDPEALAYVRLGGAQGLGLAPALLPPAEGQSLAPLLERSEALALALLPGEENMGGPRFEAALAGDYPRLSASLALGASRDWKKEKGVWKNAASGISAVLPDGRHILAASGDIEALLGRFDRPLPSVLPASLAEIGRAGSELLLWLPRPFGGADGGRGLFASDLKLPLRGFLIVGTAAGNGGVAAAGTELGATGTELGPAGTELGPAGTELGPAGTELGPAGTELDSGEYFELTVVFLMEDSSSARIYAPAARLAWYFICRGLFPGEEGLLGARFERRDELLATAGLRVSAASLSSALSLLASPSP